MLSFTEKRKQQRVIAEQNKILASAPSFSVKRKTQKVKFEAMALLGTVAKSMDQKLKDLETRRNPDGSEKSVDELDTEYTEENQATNKDEAVPTNAHAYEYNPGRKDSQRKKENTAAMALIRQIKSGDVDGENLTDEQKATLAKYSGLGGALTGIDGQKGSAFEYYTPKPIAEGMWKLAKELGFKGGKVLDPSAGVGIFGGTSPENAAVDAVELDETSGTINKLVNSGVGSNVTISPFEAVAAVTPDESYDMIMTNVPFGDNRARGNNKKHDKRYQKEDLQSYFVLRSLEKLKPNGLAVYIVPPSVTTGLGAKEVSLRTRASYMAEFLGAYRLPNKVFGTAKADTITDVIVFKKYSADVAEKIEELREQSPETLIKANVQWDSFIDGKYFKGEGKRFILGEVTQRLNQWGKEVDQVVTNASVGEIGKLLKKLPKSRVDWELLDSVETEIISYEDGDTIIQAGQTLEWRNGQWYALSNDSGNDFSDKINTIKTPFVAVEEKVTYEQANNIRLYMDSAGLSMDMPSWFIQANKELDKKPEADRQSLWNAGIIGLTVLQVINSEFSQDEAVNFLEDHPVLSESMKRVAASAKSGASKVGGNLKQGLQAIGLHYSKKKGYSALWRGDINTNFDVMATTDDASFEGLLYKNQSAWATVEEAKKIYGEDFDPLADDKWCISSDGLKIIRSDDFYVGNYGDFIKIIDESIKVATDQKIIDKLLRQKIDAEKHLDKIDVSTLSFNLFNPHVTAHEKADFMRKFVHKSAAVVYDDKTSKAYVDIDMDADTDREKLLKRVGDYMKNGSIRLGGVKLQMGNKKGIQQLRTMINTANEQFDGWVKSNKKIMARLEEKSNNPAMLDFTQVDDESPLNILGMNKEAQENGKSLTLHGYQNSFVRKMGREFSGINGFSVGLGKTLASLAAVQYAQATGVKKKTAFVLPNSVLSNWKKEAEKAYASTDDTLFVGLRVNKKGKAKVDNKFIDEDLAIIRENRHRKIFMTFETFERIRLKETTITKYMSYLGSVDSNFSGSDVVKDNEVAKSKKNSIEEVLGNKTGSAPYLEDLGIDSIVIDEAHAYKNSSKTHEFKAARFLSLGNMAARGIDAQAKAWFIRGKSSRGDGVMMLTATPITNSPLEIYSMLSLAKGHDKVNKMMLGIGSADDFMNMMTDIENEDDVTIDGVERTTNVFVGLNNVSVLRRAIDQSSTIKTAEDVGDTVELPDLESVESEVELSDATVARLQLYKRAFRYAIDEVSGRTGPNRGDPAAFAEVEAYFDEPINLIGHPFNLINKMNLLIADPELDRRATFFTLPKGVSVESAQAVIDAFNKKKVTELRSRVQPFTDEDAVLSRKVIKDEDTGEKTKAVLKVHVLAKLQPDNKTIVIDTMDAQSQERWDELTEKMGLELDVSIPPKLAALLDNVRAEQAKPRGLDDQGKKSPIVKQIIFSDILAQHSKIKRLLVKRAGISTSKIAIVTGKSNNTADEILAVQDNFNAHGTDNKIQIIIANEKAEVGINLQRGTQAIHHLSIGWTPDSVTQRNGRGVRQGNKTKHVNVYTYDADGTFDAVKRTMVNKKSDWIGDVMAPGGDDNVAVSGGLSKEQQESLINSVGDKDAIRNIQLEIDRKEAEKRSEVNRSKQMVNIDTVMKQSKFIVENDPVKNFIIPRIMAIFDIDKKIDQLEKKMSRSGVSDTVIKKTAKVKDKLSLDSKSMKDYINRNVDIEYGEGKPIDVDEAIHVGMGYDKGYGKKQYENILRSLKYSFSKIQAKDDGEINEEWNAEIDMAKALIEVSIKNFKNQAKNNGGIPEGAIDAFAKGEGYIVDGHVVTSGAFIRNERGLGVIEVRAHGIVAKFIVNGIRNDYGINDNDIAKIILQGGVGYDDALMEAAKLEDDNDINTFSDANPDVVQYRTKARTLEYQANNYMLPQPHFPFVVGASESVESELLQEIYTKQKEIVISTTGAGKGVRFKVPFDAEIEKNTTYGDNLYKGLMEYAIANNKKVKWDLFAASAEYGVPNDMKIAMVNSIINILTADDKEELATLLDIKEDTHDKIFMDFIAEKYSHIDYTGATIESYELQSRLPSTVWGIYRTAKSNYRRHLRELEQKKEAELTPPETIQESIVDQQETIAIGGDTKTYYKFIKDIAERLGSSRPKWDRTNFVWNIRREVYTELVKEHPLAKSSLTISEATYELK